MSAEGYVYFAQASGSGLVKIGWAKDPVARVRSFQCGSADSLELLQYEEGGRELEAAYHRVFARYRVRGEWFWPVPTLMVFACAPERGRYLPTSMTEIRKHFSGDGFDPSNVLPRWAESAEPEDADRLCADCRKLMPLDGLVVPEPA